MTKTFLLASAFFILPSIAAADEIVLGSGSLFSGSGSGPGAGDPSTGNLETKSKSTDVSLSYGLQAGDTTYYLHLTQEESRFSRKDATTEDVTSSRDSGIGLSARQYVGIFEKVNMFGDIGMSYERQVSDAMYVGRTKGSSVNAELDAGLRFLAAKGFFFDLYANIATLSYTDRKTKMLSGDRHDYSTKLVGIGRRYLGSTNLAIGYSF